MANAACASPWRRCAVRPARSRRRSPAERREVLKSRRLSAWIDFFSPSDWLCGAFTGHRESYGEGMSRRLVFEAPWPQRLSGRTHMLYYRDPQVLEQLAAPLA